MPVTFVPPGGREVASKTSKSTEVFESIKRAIMLGEIPIGAQLLELELAEQFNCSQGPVREALLNLQDEGLVNRMAHRGTRVSDCTRAEAEDMFRIRHGIETRGIVRSLERINARTLDALKSLTSSMEDAAAAEDEYLLSEQDRAFHRQLFNTADLPAVEPILHRCILHNHRFKIIHSGEQRDLIETARRHWSIIQAIEAGDPEAASDAIGHHVATIFDFGPAVFDRPAPKADQKRMQA